ncbi:MAG TPA: type II toxin-antitoxin system VapB family antitoxin [Oscillatoriaceae cyanobacterium]
MATNLALDDDLLSEALRLGGFRSKRETVNAALAEFIQHRKQRDVAKLFGTVDFDDAFDYKANRSRRGGSR